ncbi:tripartite tricarboxylate transporter substrate binding protein [Paeniroseomonas aquatica]|uniref:Tripartite tricarboxylate transporter substrate binding protein n=1 Tax=Paeniroseomonas aquatica TaxID=373043 RepID=A0ABT8A6C3_9PROT|nr:tripartite tricarboxylate transporter substrate binding protein [Paeniroseomonas aquatica]MDN3565264.1 tripartite tricarboxylate transporter substrate binding protein [Paeniroseomonas aquatica]
MIGRRAALGLAALAAPIIFKAGAQEARTIRLVVPYPPGGASDVIARLLAGPMGEILGQTVVVENRPGANGAIAGELVVRSPPDGLTLFMGNAGPSAMNQALLGRRLPYDSVTDFTPICLVSSVPMVLGIYPGHPAKTLQELIAYARARPGEVNYATGGIGSAPHLVLAQLATLSGIDWVQVAFRGGQQAIAAVVAGQVPFLMDTAPVVLPQVREGRVRGLAVTSAQRVAAAPEIPTIAEQGFPGFEATSWGGILGPARMPPAVTTRLNAAVVRAMDMPAVVEAYARLGIDRRASTPEAFGAHIAAELARWTEVVRVAEIKPE